MPGSHGDAGLIVTTPIFDHFRIRSKGPAEALFSAMCFACPLKRHARRLSASCGALSDATPLHLSHLRKYRQNKFADSAANWAKAVDVHGHA